jgi:guanylate kinase
MKKGRGSLFVVSAPSGAGKTTLCKELVLNVKGLEFSVSFTTRRPRPGEVDGKDYNFVSEEKFKYMVSSGEFIEWAEVHGNLYGTSRSRLEKMLTEGTDVIMDVDVRGARQIMKIQKSYHDGIYVFILPPSREALKERLQKRKNNTAEEISQRLKAAADEIRDYLIYDYVIVNNVFERALKELEAVVISRRAVTDCIDQSWVEENFLRQEDV